MPSLPVHVVLVLVRVGSELTWYRYEDVEIEIAGDLPRAAHLTHKS